MPVLLHPAEPWSADGQCQGSCSCLNNLRPVCAQSLYGDRYRHLHTQICTVTADRLLLDSDNGDARLTASHKAPKKLLITSAGVQVYIVGICTSNCRKAYSAARLCLDFKLLLTYSRCLALIRKLMQVHPSTRTQHRDLQRPRSLPARGGVTYRRDLGLLVQAQDNAHTSFCPLWVE